MAGVMKNLLSLTLALLAGICSLASAADPDAWRISQPEQLAAANRLFEKIFSGEEKVRPETWHADERALSSSYNGLNKGRRKSYVECIQVLSADGMELRTYTRARYLDEQQFCEHSCRVQKAIYPFIFASPLRYIVDRDDECVHFSLWQMDAANRELLRVHTRRFNLDRELIDFEYTGYEAAK